MQSLCDGKSAGEALRERVQAAVDRMLAAPAPSASAEAQQQHLKLLVEVYKRTQLLAEQLQVRVLVQSSPDVTWQHAVPDHIQCVRGHPPASSCEYAAVKTLMTSAVGDPAWPALSATLQ